MDKPVDIKNNYRPFVGTNSKSVLIQKIQGNRWIFSRENNIEKSLLIKSLPDHVLAVALPHMETVYYEFSPEEIVINIPIEGLAHIVYSIQEETRNSVTLDAQLLKEPFDKKTLKIEVLSESLIRVFDLNNPVSLDHYLTKLSD